MKEVTHLVLETSKVIVMSVVDLSFVAYDREQIVFIESCRTGVPDAKSG
jgi:hypothetical protein